MLTLTYGLKLPEDQDRGNVVFPAMEDNISRLDGHDHDGANSAPLNPGSVVASSQTLLAGSWVLVANGIYKQTVTLPVGLFFDNTVKEYRLPDGSVFYPSIIRLSTTQYDIYINDSSLEVTVIYK